MKGMILIVVAAIAVLCAGCVTQPSPEAQELKLLSARMERMENRILELDRDIVYLFDEKIKASKRARK